MGFAPALTPRRVTLEYVVMMQRLEEVVRRNDFKTGSGYRRRRERADSLDDYRIDAELACHLVSCAEVETRSARIPIAV